VVDFFGTPWREVTLKTVRDFLAAAGDDGIDWETKGTELPRAEQVRKAICGLANQKGGFFLIGARREQDGEWIADGVDFGVREPGTWMSDILRNGDQRLRPEPQFDVKAFDVDEEGSKLVVVMVEEIDQKPCMTGGRAALRLPGQTVWIEDPAHLRRLATEGQGVEDEAEAIALRAAEALGREEPPDEPYLRFVIAFAPTQKPEDLGARIFPQAFLDYLDEVAGELPRGPLFHEFRRDRFLDTRVADRTSVVAEDQDGRQRWKVRVAWDGSVALRLDAVADRESDARFLSEVFGPMLVERSVSAAEKLVARLGGAGRSHVVMMVGGEGFSVHVQGIPFTFFDVPSLDRAIAAPIQTRTNPDGELTDDEIARITREFLRECGAPVVEPEPAE
jgi:hypothetical protein